MDTLLVIQLAKGWWYVLWNPTTRRVNYSNSVYFSPYNILLKLNEQTPLFTTAAHLLERMEAWVWTVCQGKGVEHRTAAR